MHTVVESVILHFTTAFLASATVGILCRIDPTRRREPDGECCERTLNYWNLNIAVTTIPKHKYFKSVKSQSHKYNDECLKYIISRDLVNYSVSTRATSTLSYHSKDDYTPVFHSWLFRICYH